MKNIKKNKRLWFSITAAMLLILAVCVFMFLNPSPKLDSETLNYIKYYDSKPYNPLNLDKLIDAGYCQAINKSCEDKGIKLTVDCLIGDNKNFYIGYTLENKTGKKTNATVAVMDNKGNNLVEGVMGAAFSPVFEGNKQYVLINVSKMGDDNFIIPDEITVSCDRIDEYTNDNTEPKIIKGNWKVSFRVTNELIKEKPKSRTLNNQAQLAGTRIGLKALEEYATFTELMFKIDSTDLKSVLDYSFSLEDDKGNSYMRIYSRPPLSDNKQVKLYFNKSVLEKSLKLYLTGQDGYGEKLRIEIQ